MKSFNKAITGLIVATAMLAGTVITAASADENDGSQIPASESATSAAPAAQGLAPSPSSTMPSSSSKPIAGQLASGASVTGEAAKADGQKGTSSSSEAQGSASVKSESSNTVSTQSSQPSAQSEESAPAPQTEQQPQAQDDPDPSSIKFQLDWGGNADGSEKVHWYVQEIAPHEDVLHIGPGVLGPYDNSPAQFFYGNPVCKSLRSDIVRIVFDDAPNTHVVKTSNFAFNDYPNLKSIDNIGNIDFSRFEGTEDFYMAQGLGFNPKLTTLDLSGWGTGRTAPGAGLPGSKLSSKWKTGMTFNMMDLFSDDPALTTITGLEDWDTSAISTMAGMFETNAGGRSQLRSVGDLSRWDMSNVVYTRDMFAYDSEITNLGDLSGWNLKSDKNAEWMFLDTSISTFGNVSNWGMGNITDMQGIFANMFNLTELPGIGNWNVSKNKWFICMFQSDSGLMSLDLTGWHTDSATNMYNMFYGTTALREIPGMKDWNTSGVTNMSHMFYGDAWLDSLDISGWDTRNVTDGTKALPPNLKEIKLGPNTQLNRSYFANASPSVVGATETNGYTGRWAKADNSWLSDESGDNQSFADHTNDSGFGGLYRWQEFAEVNFEKNAPEDSGVNITGKDFKIRKVNAYAKDIEIKVPQLMYHAKGAHADEYQFKGWNTKADGTGVQYKKNKVITNFTPGQQVKLYAQWRKKSDPAPAPAPQEYTIHYEANAPKGLTATGNVPDDVFTVTPAEGIDPMHYNRTVTQNGYQVEGYQFVNWATQQDPLGGFFDVGSTIQVAPGTTTLYAVWRKAPAETTTSMAPVVTPSQSPSLAGTSTTPAPGASSPAPSPAEPAPSPAAPAPGQTTSTPSGAVAPQSTVAPVAALPAAAVTLAAAAPAPAFAPAVATPAMRAAGNAVAPAPAAGNDGVAPAQQQKRPRPTCIPEDVYQKMQSGKRGSEPVYWIEPDGTAYAQSSAWSMSDYSGLTRCEVGAAAPVAGTRIGFNFLWLLIFLIPLFLLLLAYRNGGYIVARHRDFDSATIKK